MKLDAKLGTARHIGHLGKWQVLAARLRCLAARSLPNRNRKRSRIDCGCDWLQMLTVTDRARPLLVTDSMFATISKVNDSSTETHESGHVSGAIGEGHGEPLNSNCVTGHTMARRGWPGRCDCGARCAFADLLVGMMTSDRRFGGALWHLG